MARLWLVALASLLVACSVSEPGSRAATSSLGRVGCTLPVLAGAPGGSGRQAGFVDLPGGAFRPDPSAPSGAASYDASQRRWLPVPAGNVSPDGSRYAYDEPVPAPTGSSSYPSYTRLHVVDITTRTDRVVLAAGYYRVVNWSAGGLYVGRWAVSGGTRGLWLLDLSSGSLREVGDNNRWGLVDGDSAWSGAFDTSDHNPFPANAYQGATNEVLRLDLRTGAVASWLVRPGHVLLVLGLDGAGHPVVQVFNKVDNELLDVDRPGHVQTIFQSAVGTDLSGPAPSGYRKFGMVVGGRDALWIFEESAISRFTPRGGFQQVATSGVALTPAGICT